MLSQKFRREFRAGVGVHPRWRRGLKAVTCVVAQRNLMARLDRCVVFSDKDRALLRASPKVRVVAPPLGFTARPGVVGRPGTDARTPGRVLFVGQFGREENQDAARWLTNEIWPTVRAAVPGAELVIAGAEPTPRMHADADRAPGVRITGFVDDLGPLYRDASVFVAPLRAGAGVKFKVVDAVLAALPTVTTRIGAEGIGPPRTGEAAGFAAVDDTVTGLAGAVIDVLRRPAHHQEKAERFRSSVAPLYDPETFDRTLVALYRELVRAPRRATSTAG